MQGSDSVGAREKPVQVWYWYIALCVLLALLNIGILFVGIWFLANEADLAAQSGYSVELVRWEGNFFISCGAIFALGNLALPFLPRKPWIYVLHMTNIIAAGLTCCLLPLAIPVFLGWLKPEAKAMFDFR